MNAQEVETRRAEALALWQARAPAWEKWSDHMRKMAGRMNGPLLEAAALAPGLDVLDLASGIGEPALDIAALVAPGGRVQATDAVPEMVAALRRRVAELGLENLAVDQADMEALPYAAGSFDRVTCRFGLMFTPRPEVALAEAHRVLRPGGLVATMVWGPKEDVTLFRVIDEVVSDLLGESPHARAEFTPFRLGGVGDLRAVLRAAGFAAAEERELRFSPRVEAGTPFWRPNLEMSLGDRFAALDGDLRARLEDAMTARFESYRVGDEIQLHSHVRIGIGRR